MRISVSALLPLIVTALLLQAAAAADHVPEVVPLLQAAGLTVAALPGDGWKVEANGPCAWSEAIWSQIRSLGKVREFGAGGDAFDDAQLAHLCTVISIEHIFLNGAAVTDAGLSPLARLPHLAWFMVHHSTRITGSGLPALAGCSGLRTLGFGGCLVFADAGVAAAAALPQLREVEFVHLRSTRDSFPAIAKMPNLEILSITPNWNAAAYTGADFARFSGMKRLREFSVRDMVLAYANGLAHLTAIRSLKAIHISSCVVSDADLALLKTARPDLEVTVDQPAGADQEKRWKAALLPPR